MVRLQHYICAEIYCKYPLLYLIHIYDFIHNFKTLNLIHNYIISCVSSVNKTKSRFIPPKLKFNVIKCIFSTFYLIFWWPIFFELCHTMNSAFRFLFYLKLWRWCQLSTVAKNISKKWGNKRHSLFCDETTKT